jgi:hypothetical protein
VLCASIRYRAAAKAFSNGIPLRLRSTGLSEYIPGSISQKISLSTSFGSSVSPMHWVNMESVGGSLRVSKRKPDHPRRRVRPQARAATSTAACVAWHASRRPVPPTATAPQSPPPHAHRPASIHQRASRRCPRWTPAPIDRPTDPASSGPQSECVGIRNGRIAERAPSPRPRARIGATAPTSCVAGGGSSGQGGLCEPARRPSHDPSRVNAELAKTQFLLPFSPSQRGPRGGRVAQTRLNDGRSQHVTSSTQEGKANVA